MIGKKSQIRGQYHQIGRKIQTLIKFDFGGRKSGFGLWIHGATLGAGLYTIRHQTDVWGRSMASGRLNH